MGQGCQAVPAQARHEVITLITLITLVRESDSSLGGLEQIGSSLNEEGGNFCLPLTAATSTSSVSKPPDPLTLPHSEVVNNSPLSMGRDLLPRRI